MKILKIILCLFLIPVFVLDGCTPNDQKMQVTQSATIPTMNPLFMTIGTAYVKSLTATSLFTKTNETLSTTETPFQFTSLEPEQITETMEPLLKEPMNCSVPCFWGIIPGKTTFDEARIFFRNLGFTHFEGIDPITKNSFYTISFDTGTGLVSSVTLFIGNTNLIENIVLTPDIPLAKEGNPREWVAYSPETLINRFGSPSTVQFTVGLGPNIGINMIMYFDEIDLIVQYSGYNMTPERFCPLNAPFDFVRLWFGNNPPYTPSFETIPLEKATYLSIEQFTLLMKGDPQKACFSIKGEE